MTKNQIHAAREALGLSQSGMAALLGVSLRTAHSYEHGSSIPETVAKLLRLMIAHNIKPETVK